MVDGGRDRAASASSSEEQGHRQGAATHQEASSITLPNGKLRASPAPKDIGDTATTSLSEMEIGPSSPSASERVPATLTSGNHETANPNIRLLLSDDQQTARDRTPGISVEDGDGTGEKSNELVDLVVLEEALDDGTTVKTAGTLFFTALEVKHGACLHRAYWRLCSSAAI